MRTRPLSAFSARDLEALLAEEAAHWEDELLWDYSEVRSAVAQGIDRRTLLGRVALAENGPAGYCYFIQDAGRAVVGSLFAAERQRDRGLEEALLDAVVSDAVLDHRNRRVECQTLFSTAPKLDACFRRSEFRSLSRHYLVRDLGDEPAEEPTVDRPERRFWLRPVRKNDLDRAADIIFESHRGSLDAALNLTYATRASCRTFVDTLALRGGCGAFDSDASQIAESDQGPIGVLLASRLSARSGHICQVSVASSAQGRGTGGALVRSALQAFERQGLDAASLSVTVGNASAYRLYTRLGFRVRKVFAAHAWARPPARIELPA